MPELNFLKKPISITANEFKRWAESRIGSTVIVIPEKGVYGDIIVIVNGEQKVCETGIDLMDTIINALRTYNPEMGAGFSRMLSILGIAPPSS